MSVFDRLAQDDHSRPLHHRAAEAGRLAGLALRLAWRAGPLALAGIAVLLILEALLQPLQLTLWRAVIDSAAIQTGVSAPTAANSPVTDAPLLVWISLAVAAIVARQLTEPVAGTLQALAGDRLTGYVTEQLILAANRWRGLERFEDPDFADDLERARTHASRGGLELVVMGGRVTTMVFTAIALTLLLARLHPLVPIFLVLATLPQMSRQWEYVNRTRGHLHAATPETRRLNYHRNLTIGLHAAKDIRLYALNPFLRRRYDDIFDRAIDTLDQFRLRLALHVALCALLATAAGGAVFAYVAWRIAQGDRTLGDLAMYGGAAVMLQGLLLDIAYRVSQLPIPLGFLPSLFRVLEAPPDLPIPTTPHPAPRPIRQGIVFDRVTFTYPDQSKPPLLVLSLHISPGECVALVGRNGAGKTTLVKLLLRLYDPTGGVISIDGVDLREYDLDALRRETAVAFQDFVRYDLTAGENVALGDLTSLHDPSRLIGAAERAGAADLIRQLPRGLDTPLGRELGGRDLSGGEWQKLALARAFIRHDAQLLILDEPTASLDVQTEYDVYRRFHELTEGKTTLLISHRFSTVRMADRILYLEDGRIKEEGTHADLIARGGEYARLYHLQAAQYAGDAARADLVEAAR